MQWWFPIETWGLNTNEDTDKGVGLPALRGCVSGYQEVIKLGFGIESSIRSTCNGRSLLKVDSTVKEAV